MAICVTDTAIVFIDAIIKTSIINYHYSKYDHD